MIWIVVISITEKHVKECWIETWIYLNFLHPTHLKLPSMVRFEFLPFAAAAFVELSLSTLIFTRSPCIWNCLSSASMKAKSSAGSPRNCSTMLFGVFVGFAEEAFLWWCRLSADFALTCRLTAKTIVVVACGTSLNGRRRRGVIWMCLLIMFTHNIIHRMISNLELWSSNQFSRLRIHGSNNKSIT